MRVLLLNQFFHPDLSATAQLASDLAEDLVAGGIEVTALATRGGYLGGDPLPGDETWRGVRIRRVRATSFGKATLARRAGDYASFYAAAAFELLRLPRHDVVLALTTPPLISALGLAASRARRSRLVYWVQDLYPDVAVAFGALRAGSPAALAMRAASRAVLSRAEGVVVLGEAMRGRVVAAGAVPARVHVVPNWCDAALAPLAHDRNPLRRDRARGARFLVMYSGNMGRAHDLETLLAAARLLGDRDDVAFVFLGEGARRPEVERAAANLPNVRLGPYQPRDRLSQSLSAADVHLVSLAPGLEGLLEPSKLYGAMAAARPVLYVGPSGSEVARTILREGCGRVVANGDAGALASHIRSLADDASESAEMGRRARAALEARYGRSLATRRFRDLLASL